MSLLFDKVRRQNKHPELTTLFRSAQVVIGTNVARYYYESTGKEYWKETDFPNIAPPFPHTWVECERPAHINSELHGHITWDQQRRPNRWGVGITACPSGAMPEWQNLLEDSEARWFLAALLYAQFPDTDPSLEPTMSWVIPVKPDGTMTGKVLFAAMPYKGREHSEEMRLGCEPFLHTALLTLCFMNCRNVRVTVNRPKERHQRHHRKTYGFPLVSYRTLEIDPMKRVLRTEGRSEEVGLPRALHICRGHFSHYGEAFGTGKLFGKLEGTFWVPAHVRGTAEAGAVQKEYNVEVKDGPPEDTRGA